MVRGKGDCHKHRQGCEEHVKFMEHAFLGVVLFWLRYTVHSLRADQREIVGYIDK